MRHPGHSGRLELVETWLALLVGSGKLAQDQNRNYYLITLLNENSMHRPAATGATARPASFPSAASATPVVAMLLGVRVTAYAVIRSAEHAAPGNSARTTWGHPVAV